MNVGLKLSAGEGKPVTLRFAELDDFHPDQLYAALPLFRAFRDAREQVANSKTPEAAAERIRPEAPPLQASGSLLDQIAGAASAPAAKPLSARDEGAWDDAIRRIVARHVIPSPDPRQEAMIAQVDRAASAEMRSILSHPDFRGLEAAWRSAFQIFRQVDTGVDVKIYLVDTTRHELVDHVAALANRTAGDAPWSVIVGLYTFAPNAEDCDALARIARSARQAGAPFLAAMNPRLFGCASIAATPDPDDWKQPVSIGDLGAWQRLRASADSEWVGLAMPRFLLRLPYGKKTSAIEAFDFEEMPEPPLHDAYLWGNPAVACACLLGQAFNRQGWDLRPGFVSRIDKACPSTRTAAWKRHPARGDLDDGAPGQRIFNDGIMPLASLKNSDAVQLAPLPVDCRSSATPCRAGVSLSLHAHSSAGDLVQGNVLKPSASPDPGPVHRKHLAIPHGSLAVPAMGSSGMPEDQSRSVGFGGAFAIHQASGLFADGLLFDIPGNRIPRRRRNLSPDTSIRIRRRSRFISLFRIIASAE